MAWAELHQDEKILPIKIYGSEVEIAEHAHPSNQIITDGKSLKIAHPEGFLIITEIQLPNKRRMIASDLLNGYQFSASAEVK